MEEEKVAEEKITIKRRKFNARVIVVLIVLLITASITFVSNRAEYLKIKEIGENYTSIFFKNFYLKFGMFIVSFLVTYILVFINNKTIKKGMKHFFDEEKRNMPKLPNKTICLIFGLFSGFFSLKFLYTKYIMCINAASFGKVDPIFGYDIGFYMFILPFIKSLLIYLIVFSLIMVAYTAIYYVIAINVFFEKGVDMQTLKKNTFLTQVKFWAIIFAIFVGIYLLAAAQDILTGDMINIKDTDTTTLTGAGLADTFIKLWGYRIFAVIVLISVINIIRNASSAKFKKCIASASVIPLYLVVMFGILIYFQEIYVGSSELDKEKEYISYNIEATKSAYGIDITTKTIDNYDTITSASVQENSEVLENIPLFNSKVINKTVSDTQDNATYYSYNRSNLGIYTKNGVRKLVSLTAREIIDDSNRSYNNKTFEYTHGYSVVVTDPNTIDKNGYVTTLQSEFTAHSSDLINISEPRIYFGMETDSEIIVNSKYGSEFDYPLSSTTYEEYDYEGDSGLQLGFLDRLVVRNRYRKL
jgi:hypothetical protein